MKNKGMYRLLSGVLCTSVLLSSQAYAAASADYSDFPQNWSKDAMEFAVKNNFITGVSEDKIAPKAALTRAQLAAILSRAMRKQAQAMSACWITSPTRIKTHGMPAPWQRQSS